MAREIKFRGKKQCNDEWGYGDLVHYGKDSLGIYELRYEDSTLVYPETVGQYTGLHDKNGREIYEGDVVNVPYNHIGKHIVKFENGKYNTSSYNVPECEVVGNIHDNPDLMGA